jgi:hypothetical protein
MVYPNGTIWAEWDGIVYAQHPHRKATFFFVETKQVISRGKYKNVLKRLDAMKNEYLPFIARHRMKKGDHVEYKKTAGPFLRYIIKSPEYDVGARSSDG